MKLGLYLIFFLLANLMIAQNVDNYEFNDSHIINTNKIHNYCLSSNMKYLAVYNTTGIHIVDVESKTVMNTISKGVLKTGASRILFSPDSKNLIVSLYEGTVKYYPIDDIGILSFGQDRLKTISFDISNDGRLLSILGVVPNRKKTNRKLVNGITGALGGAAELANRLSKNPNSYTSRNYNRSRANNGTFYNTDKTNSLPDYIYAVQFIDIKNPRNSYTIELKNLGFTDKSDQGKYKYLILSNDKKSMQVQNRFGNVAIIKSSSPSGFPDKVNKKISLSLKSEYETAGFNNPIAVEIYQKLGLYNYIHNGFTPTLKKSEDNIIGPRFAMINDVISNTDFNQRYIGYSSPINNPRREKETYLYTQSPTIKTPDNKVTITKIIEPIFKDIDKNIPNNLKKNPTKYALIIGNEHYTNFPNPSYAINDAKTFKKYCEMTLNVPLENIKYIEDGTSSVIKQNLFTMGKILKRLGGKGEFIFYYAGHMEVDEKGNKCILSTDSFDNEELKYEIKLNDFYNNVYAANNRKNMFFVDACYSGTNRDIVNDKDSYVTSRGGVKVKYKDDVLRGNTVSFSSSSDLQKSYSSSELKHGIFTYNLLLKIQETKGKVTLKELNDFLNREVSITALKLTQSDQNPKINYNPELKYSWSNWRLSN